MMTLQRAKDIDDIIVRYWISQEHISGVPTGRIRIGAMQKLAADGLDVSSIAEIKPEILECMRLMWADPEIDGLNEIRMAMRELGDWKNKFRQSFEGEFAAGGMGVGPMPKHDIQAMLAAHPRAAAYIEAEALSRKDNTDIAQIGCDARREVIFGDYTKAIDDMHARMDAYHARMDAFVEQHFWD